MLRDRTAQSRKSEATGKLFEDLFRNSPDGILMLDGNGDVIDANAEFQRLFGYTLAELRESGPAKLIALDPPPRDAAHRLLHKADITNPVRLTTMHRNKQGEQLLVEVLAYPLKGHGTSRGVCAIYKDVTDRMDAKGEAEYRASHDELTGLLNRREFGRRVSRTIEEAQDTDRSHVFLFMDLDQFKIINDTCGHKAGDGLLSQVAKWLKGAVRDSDSVGRMGGDEFGVLLVGCGVEAATTKAAHLLKMISANTFQWGGRDFPLSASIGIVEINADTPDLASALISADAACYAAKEKGRNRSQLYVSTDENFVSRRAEMAWVGRLNSAIAENRFVLLYQEILGLGDDITRHRELLIRYQGDDGKLLPPGAFIPSAERYNLMPMIDRWVFEHVCNRLSVVRKKMIDPGVLSVNVSGTTLNEGGFSEFVKEVLDRTGVPGSWLCFEITETAAIANLENAQQFIEDVKSFGCLIALDDFGSGMSSFNYLRSLSVDYLKIDGMFIKDMETSGVDSAMTEAINNVGKILGLRTVAEFVETPGLVKLLREMGVDYAQGYGVHKPELWIEE